MIFDLQAAKTIVPFWETIDRGGHFFGQILIFNLLLLAKTTESSLRY